MANENFDGAVNDLDSAAECKGEPSEGYWLARAQVGALLAIADAAFDIAAELRIAREQREQKDILR